MCLWETTQVCWTFSVVDRRLDGAAAFCTLDMDSDYRTCIGLRIGLRSDSVTRAGPVLVVAYVVVPQAAALWYLCVASR